MVAPMKNPTFTKFMFISFGMAIAGTVGIRLLMPDLKPLWAWLVSITAVTLLTYGYDKAVSGKKHTRVPERVLLVLVLIGGTVGALFGMSAFRHKTVKSKFRRKFWGVVALQIVATAGYYYWKETIA